MLGLVFLGGSPTDRRPDPAPANALSPLAGKNQPVDWFFAFKFNSASFPGCANAPAVGSAGLFGGKVKQYPQYSQQYLLASSKHPTLVKQDACLGATESDPLGSTFAQVYLGTHYYYAIWNDQFYDDPKQLGKSKGKPWAHSKGMLAWDDNGNGFALQVSTPSWPASGSSLHSRKTDGNTLGCITDDNIEVSQHFFCVRINKSDLLQLLRACINASVVTDPSDPQIVRNGGPQDVRKLVTALGKISTGTTIMKATLSSGVQIISKPHTISAAPWQLVSAELDAVPLRVATWWQQHRICSSNKSTSITCWPAGLRKPGAVQIATSGTWDGKTIGLTGGRKPNGNHAKIGISTDKLKPYSIFGDMNQEGTLVKNPGCDVSQNPRGGLFYVVSDQKLFDSMTSLLTGGTAKTTSCSIN
jgi:hypothetical protein